MDSTLNYGVIPNNEYGINMGEVWCLKCDRLINRDYSMDQLNAEPSLANNIYQKHISNCPASRRAADGVDDDVLSLIDKAVIEENLDDEGNIIYGGRSAKRVIDEDDEDPEIIQPGDEDDEGIEELQEEKKRGDYEDRFDEDEIESISASTAYLRKLPIVEEFNENIHSANEDPGSGKTPEVTVLG